MHRVPGNKLSGLSPAERTEEIRKNHVCNEAKYVETCTNELHPNCMKFVKNQLRIRMQGFVADKDYLKNGMPQCAEYLFEEKDEYPKEKPEYLKEKPEDPNEKDEHPKEKYEYPMFNKLLSELESIKEVLNNKNVVL